MSTKLTVSLIFVSGALFAFLPLLSSCVTFGLLVYAAKRERTTDDKSERVSPGEAALIIGGFGFYAVFCLYRGLSH